LIEANISLHRASIESAALVVLVKSNNE